jgi:predicted nuclease of restriction endonuclease-like (RecB) superfamily
MENKLTNTSLINEVKTLIEQSKQQVAISVNAALSMLYWQIGKRINDEILKDQRAEYGKQIIASLSNQLLELYGSGWSKRQLHHCIRFAEVFNDYQTVHTLCTQLSWSHIRLIIPIEDELKRLFYIEISKLEKWSVRTFQARINSMLYERTAISKKPEQTIKKDLNLLNATNQITPDLVFRDPYFLDFLGLKDTYSEKDLEQSIVAELQRFITELGNDFAFLARQKRITIDNRDYYIDEYYHQSVPPNII